MEVINQSFLPFFFATLGIGTGISVSIFILGFVAVFLEKKIKSFRR